MGKKYPRMRTLVALFAAATLQVTTAWAGTTSGLPTETPTKDRTASDTDGANAERIPVQDSLHPLRRRLIAAAHDIKTIQQLAKTRHKREAAESIRDFELDFLSSHDRDLVKSTRKTIREILADKARAQAEARRKASDDVRKRQEQELQEYGALEQAYVTIRRRLSRVQRRLSKMQHGSQTEGQQTSLDAEIADCERDSVSLENKVKEALRKEQGRSTVVLGWTIRPLASSSGDNLTVTMKIYTDLFRQPRDPNSSGNGAEELVYVFDPDRFHLVLRDMDALGLAEMLDEFDPDRFHPVLRDGKSLRPERLVIPARWRSGNADSAGRHIVRRKAPLPDEATIDVVWICGSGDCKPPVRVQIDSLAPFVIPWPRGAIAAHRTPERRRQWEWRFKYPEDDVGPRKKYRKK